MSNISETINLLNVAKSVIVLTLSLINFVPGIVGLVLNIIVFTRPTLRHEPCSLYFFSSTCFNIFVIFIVLPVRIVSNSFDIDLADYNLGICKIEIYSFHVTRTIFCWLIALACIDRYLHSSANIRIRRLSSLKTARLAIGIIILYSHMIIYFNITNGINSLGDIVPTCIAQKGIYRTFIAFWHMTMYSLCPSFLMLLFDFLTLNNIRQQRQVIPMIGVRNRISRRTDRQLLRMLAAQVLVIIICTLPFSIYRLYSSFTGNIAKDTIRIGQENLISETANTMTYFAHSSSFYLYTLTGTIFRKEVFKIIPLGTRHNQNLIRVSYNKKNKIIVLQNH